MGRKIEEREVLKIPFIEKLSNILLDELDKELERRGHRFYRYADDPNIYVRLKAAGRG